MSEMSEMDRGVQRQRESGGQAGRQADTPSRCLLLLCVTN